MVKFIKLTAIVLLSINFGIVTVLSARQHPSNPITDHFPEIELCSGHYCILGIIPGQTLWADAEPRLPNEPSNSLIENGFPGFGKVIRSSSYQINVYKGFNEDTWVSVGITSNAKPTLGEFIAFFGKPCFMTITDIGIYAQYPDFTLFVDTAYRAGPPIRLKPDAPVSGIQIPGASCTSPVGNVSGAIITWSGAVITSAGLNIPVYWHGFKLLDYYAAHQAL